MNYFAPYAILYIYGETLKYIDDGKRK